MSDKNPYEESNSNSSLRFELLEPDRVFLTGLQTGFQCNAYRYPTNQHELPGLSIFQLFPKIPYLAVDQHGEKITSSFEVGIQLVELEGDMTQHQVANAIYQSTYAMADLRNRGYGGNCTSVTNLTDGFHIDGRPLLGASIHMISNRQGVIGSALGWSFEQLSDSTAPKPHNFFVTDIPPLIRLPINLLVNVLAQTYGDSRTLATLIADPTTLVDTIKARMTTPSD